MGNPIKSIEIKSVTGIYGIYLFSPSQDRNEIFFKPSLWYPFNFKKKDKMIEELRDKIDTYQLFDRAFLIFYCSYLIFLILVIVSQADIIPKPVLSILNGLI